MANQGEDVPLSYVMEQTETPRAASRDVRKATAGMVFEKNVRIPTRDGSYVSVNIYRPRDPAPCPAIFCVSPYGKDLHIADGYPELWENMQVQIPNLVEGSTTSLHAHETLDPERWVPWGYACIRMDVPGAGKSPGKLDFWSPTEARATYDAIEWAAAQPWCNGKVGMAGVSYLATIQWRVAAEQPPHLTCICPWEGFADYYRDWNRHGGMMTTFLPAWMGMQVLPLQHGNGDSPLVDMDDGAPLGGPDHLSQEALRANRIDPLHELRTHELDDAWWRERSAVLEKIDIPMLSSGNWGGQGLHLRGNIEGFVRSASTEKWLEMHRGNHRDAFYLPKGENLQKQFFDHYLRGIENGWKDNPRLMLEIRRADDTSFERGENEWPLARTRWTRLHLHPDGRLDRTESAGGGAVSYEPLAEGARFTTEPFEAETEITGPLALKLFVSSTTTDMDLFVTLRLLRPDGTEATFDGSAEPRAPLSQGWLRASHRKLDPARSLPYRPWHAHDEIQKLTPGEIYELDVEVLPTCVVIPAGCRLQLLVEGHDFVRVTGTRDKVYEELRRRFTEAAQDGNDRSALLSGSGLFLHNDVKDKTPDLVTGVNTLHLGGAHASYLLAPIIP